MYVRESAQSADQEWWAKDGVFQSHEFGERPGLERASAHGVRRFRIGDLEDVAETGRGEMFVERREEGMLRSERHAYRSGCGPLNEDGR